MIPIATLPRIPRGSWLLVTQDAPAESVEVSGEPAGARDAAPGSSFSWVFSESLAVSPSRPSVLVGLGRHHQRQRGGWCAYIPIWGRSMDLVWEGRVVIVRAEGVYLLSEEEVAEIALHEPHERGDAVCRLYCDYLAGVTP